MKMSTPTVSLNATQLLQTLTRDVIALSNPVQKTSSVFECTARVDRENRKIIFYTDRKI